jgi:competence protein ComEC
MEENREQHQESFIEKKAGRGGTTSKGSFRAHFLNEGDGDSIVLQFPDGSLGVVDCCNPGKTHKYLRALGRQMNLDNLRLVFVAVTHAHADHDQVISLIDKLGGGKSVEEVWLSHWPVPRIERLIDYCTSESIKWFTLDGNEHSLARQYSGVTVEILAPGPFSGQKDMTAGMKKRAHSWVDESSLVLRFDYDDHTLLLTGDAGVQNWAYVRYTWHQEDKLRAQVLKVSHHGSRYNLETGLVQDVEPKFAIVSAAQQGEGRLKALPNEEVKQVLAKDERSVYYTYNGSCIVTLGKTEQSVQQLNEKGIYDLPDLPTS